MRFPIYRPRRLRQNPQLRALVRETELSVSHLVLPLFVREGSRLRKPIRSMPGQFQLSVDELVKESAQIAKLGVPAVILTALFARGYELAERVTLATTACFCSCYTLFWLLPTVGPHYWFAPALGPGPYRGYVFNQLLHAITSRGEIRGGACPSSHLAVALLLTLWARRAAPRLFPVLAVITALLVPAVVYLRAHYLVDVPAGLAAGLLAYGLSARGSFSDRKTK